MERTSSSVSRVRAALEAAGLDDRIQALDASTRTADEAAAAVGCDVAQIVKCLVFRGRESGRALLVIASGANRVDERKLAAAAGEAVGKADAAFVREQTGFAIGGVAPLAHPAPIATYVDQDLLTLPRLWAAAGTPHAVFELTPEELLRVVPAKVVELRA